ncbi:MAG: NAD(P)H-dependent oxidoreductase subunit E [Actinomycetota bacterium]
MFSEELRGRAEALVDRYPQKRSALLPLLHLVQHADGHISEDGVAECAELLELTKAEVGAVATFYTMYKREEMGRHLVSVCTSFSCAVRGGAEVYERLKAKLGLAQNETSADGSVTLEHAECLGNCEGAPLVTVDYLNYECQSVADAEALVDAILAGEPLPAPTRGPLPPGIREASYRLAGLGPVEDPDGPLAQAAAKARGHHGGPTPAATAPSGPGWQAPEVIPTFSEAEIAEREAAKEAVRGAGFDPDDVAGAGGASAREFPSRDPDFEAQEPGTAPGEKPGRSGAGVPGTGPGPEEDPRAADQVEAEADEESTDG